MFIHSSSITNRCQDNLPKVKYPTPTLPSWHGGSRTIDQKMQKEAYLSFYFRPSFIWKHFKRLKSFNIIKQYYQGLKYILGVSQ